MVPTGKSSIRDGAMLLRRAHLVRWMPTIRALQPFLLQICQNLFFIDFNSVKYGLSLRIRQAIPALSPPRPIRLSSCYSPIHKAGAWGTLVEIFLRFLWAAIFATTRWRMMILVVRRARE